MISLESTAVHRSIRPKTPSPTASPPDLAAAAVGTGRSWSDGRTSSTKRRRSCQGPPSARKRILPSPTEDDISLNFNFNNPEITLTLIQKNTLNSNRTSNGGISLRRDVVDRYEKVCNLDLRRDDGEDVVPLKNDDDEDARGFEFLGGKKLEKTEGRLVPFVNSDEISIEPISRGNIERENKVITGRTTAGIGSERTVPPKDGGGGNELDSGAPTRPRSAEVCLLESGPQRTSSPETSRGDRELYDDMSTAPAERSSPAAVPAVGRTPSKLRVCGSIQSKITKAVELLKSSEKRSIDIDSSTPELAACFASTNSGDISVSYNCDEVEQISRNVENWDLDDNAISVSKVPSQTVAPLQNDSDVPYYMIGFPNPPGENRCWLNAALHALFALPLTEHLSDINLHECSHLTKTLIGMKMFWQQGVAEKQKLYQTLKIFKEDLSILDESYPSECQQDVSEFLMSFLNYVSADFDKLLDAEKETEEVENIPENRQDPRKAPKSTQPCSRRQPLADIPLLNGGLKRGQNPGEACCLGPKSRKPGPTYTTQDLLSPKANRLSNPTDPAYKVHTPPQGLSVDTVATRHRNPINEYLLLHMMDRYTCKSCMKKRQKKVDNLMLYVDVPLEDSWPPIGLEMAIGKYLAPEDRLSTCGSCKHDTLSVRTIFRRWPRVLMVQINRYSITGDGLCAKINTAVSIPEKLDLDLDTLADDTQEETSAYEPVCVIAHVGSSMDCGHYTCYVRHAEDRWFHYNDMSVTPMTREEALAAVQTTAYLVFFLSEKLLLSPSSG